MGVKVLYFASLREAFGKDREELTAMYGRSSTFSGILEGSENPDSAGYTKSLTSLFPKS